ncbi:MAG TPA: pentapeptide repeat-containing protein [Methanotrichaceae archaeon]|nr:pentapeptide repeat-containing protein [Methanotrichaceae archaeon]
MAFSALSSIALADQKSVPADEILQQISSGGSVDYDGIAVTGDLNLSRLDRPVAGHFYLINSRLPQSSFEGVTFDKEVSFWGTSFGRASFNHSRFSALTDFSNVSFGHASFTGATFYEPVFFDGAEFKSNVSFEESSFKKDTRFNQAMFRGDALFNYTRFGSYSYFTSGRFLGDALFSDVVFQSSIDFSSAGFEGQANFFQTRFENTAGFDAASFRGPAQFGLTRFEGLSSFGDAVFYSDADFVLSRFSEAANFFGAHFMDNAVFGLVKFGDIASFQNATFEGDLNFKSSRISTLMLSDVIFGRGSRIWLNDADFSRLKGRWSEIGDHVGYDAGAFTSLVDNYRGLGWNQDEDDCYYKYRLMSQAEKGPGWSKAIDVLAWISCGYGVRPSYTVAWALLTILAFALIFWRGDGIRRSAKPLQGPAEVDSVPERATFRSAFFFSTMIFLSQGPIDFLPRGKYRYFVILEGITGWLLLALFLVTLGKVMIR